MMMHGDQNSSVDKSIIKELQVAKNLWATTPNVSSLEHISRFWESIVINGGEIWLVFRGSQYVMNN